MASPSSSSTTASASTVPSTAPEAGEALQHVSKKQTSLEDHYRRWRPSFHLQPNSGWINDPCAPGYDAKTGLYHVSFQWNPSSPDWGDICWGAATSPDMINWTVRDDPILSPNTEYDGKGVFTGCFIPSQEGDLTYAYTSVGALPVHHTLPHPRGSESLSLARSSDSGKTWQKVSANPILPCEPEGLDVTGWRDPYVAQWPGLARVLDLKGETLFAIISGGIRNVTPTTFLYAIDTNDLTKWKYLGPLIDFGLNLRPSRWSGDLGRNWEVTNFVTLQDQVDASVARNFLIMGAEGCLEDEEAPDASPLSRPVRGQLWMSGDLKRKDSGANMSYSFGGHLDHGCLYAANSFFDPRIQMSVVWGWIPEDDLCDELRHAQGWSGMLSMPRELRMQTLRHVVGTCGSRLKDITSIETEIDEHGSYTVRTLASQPLQSLVQSLRKGPRVRHSRLENTRLDTASGSQDVVSDGLRTDKWELNCSFAVSRTCQKVGLQIGHTADFSHSTTLTFSPAKETFTIERPALPGLSAAESDRLISSKSETAPHTLFITSDGIAGQEQMEPLQIHAWRDNSVMEVFVNGRTAISTRLYAANETFGVRFFGNDGAGSEGTVMLNAEMWDGIGLPA